MSNEVIFKGNLYKWTEDQSACKGCPKRDKCTLSKGYYKKYE